MSTENTKPEQIEARSGEAPNERLVSRNAEWRKRLNDLSKSEHLGGDLRMALSTIDSYALEIERLRTSLLKANERELTAKCIRCGSTIFETKKNIDG